MRETNPTIRADVIAERSSAQGAVQPEARERGVEPAAPVAANALVGMGRLVGGRYLVERRLGDGHYSDVYLAVDQALSDSALKQEHRVALHIFHAHVAKQARVLQKLEQVYREPHLWAHPNVARVRGFGSDQGRYFFVTELLQGVSLRTILDDSPEELPSEREVLAVLRGVGDAVKYAHAKGVVHGNLRPEKIFVTLDYTVKVLDLLPITLARSGLFFLEDAALQPPDPRDDVYGLACIAYEMWSGKHPYNGNSPREALEADIPLVPIAQLDTNRWAALARGLALRRAARTASVQEFLEDIGVVGDERLQSAETVAPAPTPRLVTPRIEHPEPPLAAWAVAPVAPLESGMVPEPVVRRPARRRQGGVAWAITLALAVVALGVLAAYRGLPMFQAQVDAWLAMAATRAAELRSALDETLERASPVAPPAVTSVAAPALPSLADSTPSAAPAAEPIVDSSVPPLPSVEEPDPQVGGSESSGPALAIESSAPAAPASVTVPSVVQPETFAFTVSSIAVAESEASVVAEIRRSGGTLGESSVVWWTTDGTALADEDYASFGARVEKFALGERTLRVLVPIVGDSQVEGDETFYIHARAAEGTSGRAAAVARVEVVIRDDD